MRRYCWECIPRMHAFSLNCSPGAPGTLSVLWVGLQRLEVIGRGSEAEAGCMQANISKTAEPEDWRFREAATTALGAILEGPSTDRLAAYVSQGLSFLLHAMKEPHQQVRHSTAWTIGMLADSYRDLIGGAAAMCLLLAEVARMEIESFTIHLWLLCAPTCL